MSDHLDKAKGAVAAAGAHCPDRFTEDALNDTGRDLAGHLAFADLLKIASVQAEIAQAEALTRIAEVMERKEKLHNPRSAASNGGYR